METHIKLDKSIKRKGTNQVTHTTVLLMLMSHSQPLDNKSNKKYDKFLYMH